MLTNNAQVVQFYSAPLACFADALDRRNKARGCRPLLSNVGNG